MEAIKELTIYTNGGETYDEITVIFNDSKRMTKNGYEYDCIGASYDGRYYYQHSTAYKGAHLGKEIKFADLDANLQKMILNELNS